MRAAGCGVEELVWHYIWMVSQSAASKRFQIAVFWGVVPRNAGGHISNLEMPEGIFPRECTILLDSFLPLV
jgi:hypothetical protein